MGDRRSVVASKHDANVLTLARRAGLREPPAGGVLRVGSPRPGFATHVQRVHDAGSLVMHMVGEVAEAVRAAEAGVDVIVAQGTEGGGQVGWMASMALVPMVVQAVAPIPVLAAGGIADGRGLVPALALGAEVTCLARAFLPLQSPRYIRISSKRSFAAVAMTRR